jgi:hypothetical protein
VHGGRQRDPDDPVAALAGVPGDGGERLDRGLLQPAGVELGAAGARHQQRVADAHQVADAGVDTRGHRLRRRRPRVQPDDDVHAHLPLGSCDRARR